MVVLIDFPYSLLQDSLLKHLFNLNLFCFAIQLLYIWCLCFIPLMFSPVVASGLWVAPGDSEEVAAALSQALRNCIERSLFIISFSKIISFLLSQLDLFGIGIQSAHRSFLHEIWRCIFQVSAFIKWRNFQVCKLNIYLFILFYLFFLKLSPRGN